jgi:hypothetical protein
MTLISSWPSTHGMVLVADSQETVGGSKYAVLKLEPATINGCDFVIAGSGDGDVIDTFIERFKRKLTGKKIDSLDAFRGLFEKEVPKRKGLEFLAAAHIGQEFEVWKCKLGTFIPASRTEPTLIGYVSHLYQHVAKTLYAPDLPGGQLIIAGLRVLELARQSCPYVDRPYRGAIVSKWGIATLDNELLGELTESTTVFESRINRLLLACSDTAMQAIDFVKMIEEFREDAVHLRNDYLQAIGKLDFKKLHETGVGYGIPLVPLGTLIHAHLDPQTGNLVVSVEENEDMAANLRKLYKDDEKK